MIYFLAKKKSTKNLKELKPLNKEEEERKMSVDIQKSEEDVGIASQIKGNHDNTKIPHIYMYIISSY